MRPIIYALGAVGGVIAVALVEAGNDVLGIARAMQQKQRDFAKRWLDDRREGVAVTLWLAD